MFEFPSLVMPRFECDQCGACCQGTLIVEADAIDVLREPRLIDADRHHAGKPIAQVVNEIQNEWKAVIIACGRPCAFLGTDKHCTIYPTRPSVCVGLQAGDEQCQEARAAAGIPPLLPVDPRPHGMRLRRRQPPSSCFLTIVGALFCLARSCRLCHAGPPVVGPWEIVRE